MHTEDEAKELWCPFSRAIAAHRRHNKTEWRGKQPAFNRIVEDGRVEGAWPTGCACVASQCSAWRWWGERPVTEGDFASPTVKVGYCGLAGNPE